MWTAVGAALKKIALFLVTNKKALKTICGVVLGVLFIVLLPVIAVLSIFSGDIDLNLDGLQEIIAEQQAMGERTMKEIEEIMTDAGFSELRIKEAQTLYEYGLFGFGNEDGFAERYVACFKEEQTDEELIAAVNETFGTVILTEEFADVVSGMREEYTAERENNG